MRRSNRSNLGALMMAAAASMIPALPSERNKRRLGTISEFPAQEPINLGRRSEKERIAEMKAERKRKLKVSRKGEPHAG